MTAPKKSVRKMLVRKPVNEPSRPQPNCRDDNEMIMASQAVLLDALAEVVHYLAPSDRATQEKLWTQSAHIRAALAKR
jgi:hypothetical protein